MTEFFTGITALAALLAAGAAWKSARASQRGSALAQKAALLGAIPILVPWVEAKSTTLKVLNRGASDAHETRWYLIQGETVSTKGLLIEPIRGAAEFALPGMGEWLRNHPDEQR